MCIHPNLSAVTKPEVFHCLVVLSRVMKYYLTDLILCNIVWFWILRKYKCCVLRRQQEEKHLLWLKLDCKTNCTVETDCETWNLCRCLTFCHSASLEARLEQAATNQQFPSWPWCRSWALMPSTNRWGSLHNSYKDKDILNHVFSKLNHQLLLFEFHLRWDDAISHRSNTKHESEALLWEFIATERCSNEY